MGTARAFGFALCHAGSLGAILLAAFGAALLPEQGDTAWIGVNAKELAPSVFQVAGTMVALALPAAQLAGWMVTELERELTKLVEAAREDRAQRQRAVETVRTLTMRLKSSMAPAWRSAAYALVSLLLASLASVMRPMGSAVSVGMVQLRIDQGVVAAALAALIVAAVWLYPTARYAFRLEYLDDIRAAFADVLQAEDAAAAAAPPA